jgi:hypothetical protein
MDGRCSVRYHPATSAAVQEPLIPATAKHKTTHPSSQIQRILPPFDLSALAFQFSLSVLPVQSVTDIEGTYDRKPDSLSSFHIDYRLLLRIEFFLRLDQNGRELARIGARWLARQLL